MIKINTKRLLIGNPTHEKKLSKQIPTLAQKLEVKILTQN